MAITYPLSVAAFWAALRFSGRPEFDLLDNRKQSQTVGGGTRTAFLAAPKWKVDVALAGGRHNANMDTESDLKHLRNRDGSLLAYDIRRPYPAFDPRGEKLGSGSIIGLGEVAASGSVVSGAYSVEGVPVTRAQAVSVVGDAGTYFDAAGVLQTSAANGLRVDYDPVTLVARGIMAETAFTNLLSRSREFDNNTAWTKARATVTPNVGGVTDPWGTNLADKLVETAAAGTHLAYYQYTTSNFVNFVVYFLAKAGERSKIRVELTNNTDAGAGAVFDLAAGTVGAANSGTTDLTGASATIRPIGNGWYWCEVEALKVSGDNDCYPAIYLLDAAGSPSYTGDGTSGVYLAHAQLEEGVTGHMPVVTTTAAVARAADQLTLPAFGRNDWSVTFDNGFVTSFSNAWPPPHSRLASHPSHSTRRINRSGQSQGQQQPIAVPQGTAAVLPHDEGRQAVDPLLHDQVFPVRGHGDGHGGHRGRNRGVRNPAVSSGWCGGKRCCDAHQGSGQVQGHGGLLPAILGARRYVGRHRLLADL
jgi:hypothetical protein